jgi:transcription elongation factor Elf1
MSKPIKFFFTCPRCEHEQEVGVILGSDPIIGGPPEACDPGSPDEVDSGGACEKCGYEFEEDQLFVKASNMAFDRAHEYPEPDGR